MFMRGSFYLRVGWGSTQPVVPCELRLVMLLELMLLFQCPAHKCFCDLFSKHSDTLEILILRSR